MKVCSKGQKIDNFYTNWKRTSAQKELRVDLQNSLPYNEPIRFLRSLVDEGMWYGA